MSEHSAAKTRERLESFVTAAAVIKKHALDEQPRRRYVLATVTLAVERHWSETNLRTTLIEELRMFDPKFGALDGDHIVRIFDQAQKQRWSPRLVAARLACACKAFGDTDHGKSKQAFVNAVRDAG